MEQSFFVLNKAIIRRHMRYYNTICGFKNVNRRLLVILWRDQIAAFCDCWPLSTRHFRSRTYISYFHERLWLNQIEKIFRDHDVGWNQRPYFWWTYALLLDECVLSQIWAEFAKHYISGLANCFYAVLIVGTGWSDDASCFLLNMLKFDTDGMSIAFWIVFLASTHCQFRKSIKGSSWKQGHILREHGRKQTSFILLIKQAEWSYMTDKIPCSSGISLLPQGIYLCYKPVFGC